MKSLITTLAFIIIYCGVYAQTSNIDSLNKYLKFEEDKPGATLTIASKDSIADKSTGGLFYVIDLVLQYQKIIFTLTCPQIGCYDNGKIDFFLNDSTKTTTYSDMPGNCIGGLGIIWHGTSGKYKLLTQLANTPIKRVKLKGGSTPVEIAFTPNQSLLLYNQLKWLKYCYDNPAEITKLINSN